MGTVKIKHLVERNGAFYFQATPKMRRAGIFSEPLGRNLVKAIERTEFLNAQWDAARAGGTSNAVAPGTVNWLIRDFQNSEWYRVLKQVTQVEADYHLAIIVNAPLAKFPAHAITRRHCRQFHNKLVQAKGRPSANKSMKWLRRLMSYAVEIGLRETNPALRMGLKHNPPREQTWTIDEIEAFKHTAIEDGKRAWALAVHLGYDTSQRLSDILGLTWNDFDAEGLYFRQRKTGAKIYIALRAESLAMLAETERRAVHIIVGDVMGKPIGHNSYFGRVFRKLRAKSGIRTELRFHDLRRTAATEVSAGGGTVESLTGHRPGSPALKHYVVPGKEASREAQRVRKPETGTKV